MRDALDSRVEAYWKALHKNLSLCLSCSYGRSLHFQLHTSQEGLRKVKSTNVKQIKCFWDKHRFQLSSPSCHHVCQCYSQGMFVVNLIGCSGQQGLFSKTHAHVPSDRQQTRRKHTEPPKT